MKIAIASDLHLEFGQFELTNEQNSDVLVLAGDIFIAKRFESEPTNSISEKFHQFFEQANVLFKDVILIMGNHEHYHGDIATDEEHIRKCISQYKNIHLLERQTIKIGDITFIGGTMWTDCNKNDPQTLMHLRHTMNDFQIIKNSNNKIMRRYPKYNDQGVQEGFLRKSESSTFTPEDSTVKFDNFVGYLENVVEGNANEKFVVCSHHAPSRLSIHPRYSSDLLMNGGFCSELFDFIADRPQIKTWIHGHTHHKFDYMIGETRVVCNPRGYVGYEPQSKGYELKTIEV